MSGRAETTNERRDRLERLVRTLTWRYHTHRDREKARRAFYKWVCKEGLYTNVEIDQFRLQHWGVVLYIRPWHPGYGGAGLRNGYPLFDAPRSITRDQWEQEFVKHREAWKEELAEIYQQQAAQSLSRRERYLAADDIDAARSFFQLHEAASQLLSLGADDERDRDNDGSGEGSTGSGTG